MSSTAYSALGRQFRFAENGTTLPRDTIAGITTFIVMSYIIFVNPAILGFSGVQGLQKLGLPFDEVLTSTCLVAGVMTIAMGLFTNRAYAIAPGLGLNAFVAFTLVANEGLGFPEAMGLVVIEGLAITILVVVGLREKIMRAIPLELKKAIAVGIGLFIGFIGLVNAGLVIRGEGTPVDLAKFTTWTTFIESASGVGVGGRTGWVSLITGALFFPFIFIAPLIGMVPPQATAAALIVVGYLMMSVLSEAEEAADLEEGVVRT